MAKIRISKTSVDAAQPGGREETYWDDRLPGFGLKVTPTGSKVYVYRYRIARPGMAAKTAPRKYTIGRHGELTPDQARKRAQDLAALVSSGIDPREQELEAYAARDDATKREKEQRRLEADLAFSRVADLWLKHYEHEKGRRPSSVRQAKLVVNNHLKARLAGKPIPHIGRSDLQPIIDAIPLKQRGMRRAVFAYASVLFGWAHKRGDIAENPLIGMARPEAPKARDRVLTDNELESIWQASGKLGDPFGPFLRLLILTGQRRGEVAAMNWAELDRTASAWTIPADRAKNDTAHIVPLNTPAITELDRLAAAAGSDGADEQAVDWPKGGFVLTTTGRSPISGISKAKNALDAAAAEIRDGEALPGWRIHDLRRTVATGLQKLGVRFEVTEAVLNHVSGAKGGVAGIYQRHDWKDEKRTALDAWASHIAALLTPADKSNVVSLAEARA
jgi:integrase